MRLGLSSGRCGRRVAFCLIFVFVLVIFCCGIYALQPAFLKYSRSYANNIANSVVNEAVKEVFEKENYSNMTTTYASGDSGIKSIETDAATVNRLKADITEAIQENIENRRADIVYVPLGSAANFYFLAGLGPKIPIRIYPVSIVNTDFNDEFEAVGINQVKHRLYLDVSVEMSFVGFAFAKSETVKTTALLTETIIVGDTPQYYGSGEIATPLE